MATCLTSHYSLLRCESKFTFSLFSSDSFLQPTYPKDPSDQPYWAKLQREWDLSFAEISVDNATVSGFGVFGDFWGAGGSARNNVEGDESVEERAEVWFRKVK